MKEPEADEGRLLTDDEVDTILGSVIYDEYALEPTVRRVRVGQLLKAQDLKTARMLNTECQKRVERIFEEIEKAIDEESYPDDEEQWYRLTIPKSWWKRLKQREGVEK